MLTPRKSNRSGIRMESRIRKPAPNAVTSETSQVSPRQQAVAKIAPRGPHCSARNVVIFIVYFSKIVRHSRCDFIQALSRHEFDHGDYRTTRRVEPRPLQAGPERRLFPRKNWRDR